jgi:hypothetical protein
VLEWRQAFGVFRGALLKKPLTLKSDDLRVRGLCQPAQGTGCCMKLAGFAA